MPRFDFQLPDGVRFSCRQCGDCCRTWNVMLRPDEVERLGTIDWGDRVPRLAGETTIVETKSGRKGPTVARLARRDDGSCVFLGDDDRCEVHRHFGADAKPWMCRAYPFGFSSVGDRVAVDCSFSCSAVSRRQGQPLTVRREELDTLLDEAGLPAPRPHRIGRRRLDDDQLLGLQRSLVRLIREGSLSLRDRVRCAVRFARLVSATDPSGPAFARLADAMVDGLPRQIASMDDSGWMDRTQRAVFYQWLFLTLNPLPANADLRSPAERGEKARRAAGERFRRRLGRPTVDGRELAVDFDAVLGVAADTIDHDADGFVASYFEAKIVGQRYLVGGRDERPFDEAVPAFFLTFPMLVWTAKAFAADDGANAVDPEHTRRAVRLVDRTLGQIDLGLMPKPLAKGWRFLMTETDIVAAATNEVLRDREEAAGGDPRLHGLDLPI